MKTPTEFELQQLMKGYDLAKARECYDRRKSTQPEVIRHSGSKIQQRQELQTRVHALSQRMPRLEALIQKREDEEARENRRAKARKERAAKDKDKPKTAAEKAEAARGSRSANGGSSDKKPLSASELKSLATKVKGQIAVAKQKLAAL